MWTNDGALFLGSQFMILTSWFEKEGFCSLTNSDGDALFAWIFDLSLHLLAMITCQWFFTALSVRPGNCFAITAHLLPWIRWQARSLSSSSSVKGLLLILGSNWLNHLNLQLFPDLIYNFWVSYQSKSYLIFLFLQSIYISCFSCINF